MASLKTEHGLGRHKTLKSRGCALCFPIAPDATPVEVPADTTAVLIHPYGINEEGQATVRPVKPKRSRKQQGAALGVAIDAADAPVVTQELVEGALDVTVIPSEPQYPTREAWMLAAVEAMRPEFVELGVELPQVRISVGWPGGRGNKQNVVGQCWMPEAVSDKLPAIFVSPVQDKPLDVLETVRHELVHAAGHRGHRGGFRKLAKSLGFIDPMKSSPAGPELKEQLAVLAESLGPWPHAKVNPGGGLLGIGPSRPAVQATRMLKVECPDCGCVLRMTRKWLDEAGVPTCGCGSQMQEAV